MDQLAGSEPAIVACNLVSGHTRSNLGAGQPALSGRVLGVGELPSYRRGVSLAWCWAALPCFQASLLRATCTSYRVETPWVYLVLVLALALALFLVLVLGSVLASAGASVLLASSDWTANSA